jgi:hypothetical protein
MQSSLPRRFVLPVVAAIVFSCIAPAGIRAQDDGAAAGGGVARIDVIAGDVAIQRGDSNEILAAVPNAPVLGADYVTTGPDGRAEVGFDGRSAGTGTARAGVESGAVGFVASTRAR